MEMIKLMLLVVVIAATPLAGHAVTIGWVTVGGAGNAADTQVMSTDSSTGYGAVAYTYQIGKYEVTNAQYAEFLNAVAATDTYTLYNTEMTSNSHGGITRSGNPGNYTYGTIVGRADMPVNYVSYYDCLRFANWLNNGQTGGGTETGAYTLLGGTPIPSNGLTVGRNAGAPIFLPSEDEWYKAAYFDPASSVYYLYPAGLDAETACATPDVAANTANCWPVVQDFTDVGSYPGSASPNGTFDQGGNAWEWNETPIGSNRGVRGGSFRVTPNTLAATMRNAGSSPTDEIYSVGFRLARVPEPGRGLLLMTALLTLTCIQRTRN